MLRLSLLGCLVVIAAVGAVLLARHGVVASDFWRDLVAWFSLFLTVLGLGYTIIQVTLIESASRAAHEAAARERTESRKRLFQFTAASVHKLISDVDDYRNREEWGKAVLRLHDLADHTAQIGGQRADWMEIVRGLREAAAECAALESGRHKRPTHEKWTILLTDLRTRLDDHFGTLQT
jgi:hypothetical protein